MTGLNDVLNLKWCPEVLKVISEGRGSNYCRIFLTVESGTPSR